jgi:hypothetical protein
MRFDRMTVTLLTIALLAPLAGGCATTRSAYYNAWEKFGYAKRDRLVNNVKSARDEQDKAKQQFSSALDQFKSVVNVQGGDLEATYNKLNKSYEGCEDRASAVNSKIASVKNVGVALFDEWKGEVAQMKDDPSLQSKSQALYDKTHENYDQMVSRMDTAAASMTPVLTHFKNHVLYIKANVNAQALASLAGTEVQLGGEIDNLIKEMEASIAEADKFISQIEAK